MNHFAFYVKLSQLVIYAGKKSKLFMHSFSCIVEKASLAKTIWRTEVVMISHHYTFYDFDSGNACMQVLTLEYTDMIKYIHWFYLNWPGHNIIHSTYFRFAACLVQGPILNRGLGGG